MKTKNKILLAIGLVAALGIGFLVGILVDFPKTDQKELAGSIGKAEKYRKVQMTAKDIQLRTELVKDTAQLKSMIQGLVYFSVFTGEVSNDIELAILAFQARGMGTEPGEAGKMKALQDYSDYIRNNNKTLKATIALLTGLYLKDTADLSQDVEKKLRDFGTYVNTLIKKYSALSEALVSMDNYLVGNKTLQAHKTEIAQLRSIRDQLLVKGIQLGGVFRNKEIVSNLISYAVAAQDKLNFAAANQKLSLAGSSEKLPFILSQGGIQAAASGLAIATSMYSQGSIGSGLVFLYDKAALQFIFLNDKSQIYQSFAGTSNLQIVGSFGTDKLNIVLSNYSLQDIIQSQALYDSLNANTLLQLFSMDNLQVVVLSTGGLNNILTLCANENLGFAPPY